MRVAVCAVTYQRPEGLEHLIAGLDKLTFSKSKPSHVELVVVDNEPIGRACRYCETVRSNLTWTLKCFSEPRRGISHARNKAVTCTVDNADFLAFIDDDEVPEPSWLDELLHVQRLHDADVVAGRVLSAFAGPVPAWIDRGGFFENDRYPTGHLLDHAHTNNVLIRSEVFKNVWPAFDERFSLSGGEDTHFFMRVHRAGYKIVWADDAVVWEWIPKARANTKWLVRRAYNGGNNYSLCLFALDASWAARTKRVVKAGGRIVQGTLLLPISVVLGRHTTVKALQYIAVGIGALAGVIGKSDERYRKAGSI